MHHLRHVPWDDIFTLSASAGASKFCEWVQVATDAYINHRNHNPRNQFFHLHQKDKYSESKVKFRQASNCCKRVLEAAKLAYANKKRSPLLPRNLALRIFGKLPIVFSTKENLLYLLYSTAQRCCLLHLISKIVCWKLF